jgi:hypothetical protein
MPGAALPLIVTLPVMAPGAVFAETLCERAQVTAQRTMRTAITQRDDETIPIPPFIEECHIIAQVIESVANKSGA